MADLPRPALQLVEPLGPLSAEKRGPTQETPPEQPGAPKQDGPAMQPSARSERAGGDSVGWAIYERFPKLGEAIAGRGPHA